MVKKITRIQEIENFTLGKFKPSPYSETNLDFGTIFRVLISKNLHFISHNKGNPL
jgi:hypothetical protein